VRTEALVAAMWWVAASAGAAAQPARPVGRAAQRTDAVKKAEDAVGKAAIERKITLTEEAKKTLALEVVRQGATRPTPATAEPSPAAVERVLTSVADQAKSTAVTADVAKAAVQDDKKNQVAVTIDKDVAAQFARTKKTLTDDARARLRSDLQEQTDALSRSGLDVETIRSRNQAYLTAVDSLLTGATITEPMYQQVRAAIFQRLVKLTLETVPAGASVMMSGSQIGVTPIVSKPFEAGKSYRFEFQLTGYRPATREFYVAAAPEAQALAELLAAQEGAPPSDRPQDPDTVPTGHRTRVISFVLGGVVLLLIIVGLATRRRS
jgi:PEGA domain-containing protein